MNNIKMPDPLENLESFRKFDNVDGICPKRILGPRLQDRLHLSGQLEISEWEINGIIYRRRELYCKCCGDLIKREVFPQ